MYGGFNDPGRADNMYAEAEAKRLADIARADIARGDNGQAPDPVETRSERFTSAVWLIIGLGLAAALVWIVAGAPAGPAAAVIALIGAVAVLVRRHRLNVEEDRPQP
jgi:hypothetical protein